MLRLGTGGDDWGVSQTSSAMLLAGKGVWTSYTAQSWTLGSHGNKITVEAPCDPIVLSSVVDGESGRKRGQSQLRPEGRNRRGETRLRGPEVLGPLRGLGIRPLVSVIRGLGNPIPRGPLELWKGTQGLGGGSSGASERCVRFQQSGKIKHQRFPE